MPKIHELFKQAMSNYGIKVKDLAEYAGISAQHLTEFRQGRKWVSEETLESLLENMDHLSPGSKKYFCQLLANQSVSKPDNKKLLVALIENATSDEIEAALLAIGRKWKQEDKKSTDNNKHSMLEAIAS